MTRQARTYAEVTRAAERRSRRSTFVAGLLAGATLVLLIHAVLAPPYMVTCPEDAVPLGTGQFEDGYWQGYVCVALDDLQVRGE